MVDCTRRTISLFDGRQQGVARIDITTTRIVSPEPNWSALEQSKWPVADVLAARSLSMVSFSDVSVFTGSVREGCMTSTVRFRYELRLVVTARLVAASGGSIHRHYHYITDHMNNVYPCLPSVHAPWHNQLYR